MRDLWALASLLLIIFGVYFVWGRFVAKKF